MQLSKLSLIASLLVAGAHAEDYVAIEYLQYNENDSRVSVSAPSLEINKDFGADYTLNASFVLDSVSGASPTYYDATSGASAHAKGPSGDIRYGNVNFDEQRAAGNVNLTTRFANRDELKVGLGYSAESDFYSFEGSASYMHYLDDSHNQSVSLGASYQSNEVLIKDCSYNAACDASSGASQKMTNDGYQLQLSFSQVIDTTSVADIGVFYGSESGYLSSPYHNIVRNANTVYAELKPDARDNYGVKLGYKKALSETLFAHLAYKYYSDDWGIDSHTIDTKLLYELNDDLTIGGGVRYYMQSEADFYAKAFTTEKFASSDERVSDFNALTYKAELEYKFSDDLSYNLGANLYDQSTGLQATFFTTGLKYKF